MGKISGLQLCVRQVCSLEMRTFQTGSGQVGCSYQDRPFKMSATKSRVAYTGSLEEGIMPMGPAEESAKLWGAGLSRV